MLPEKLHSIAQGQALCRPVLYRFLECGARYEYVPCRRHKPSPVHRVAIPQVDAVTHVLDVVQVGVFQLPHHVVYAEMEIRCRTSELTALGTQLLQQAKRMELAVLFGVVLHGNER